MKSLSQILLESEAADQAHKLGLVYGGFGKWRDKSGQTVAKTVGGKLVKVDGSAPQKSNGEPPPRPARKPREKKKKPTIKQLAKQQQPKKDPYADVPEADKAIMMEARKRGYRVPPAWRECWIDPNPEADLQVKGKDAKGRMQYLYSVNFRTKQDAEKFERVKQFTQELPSLMRNIEGDLEQNEEALVLYLIAQTGFRVGSNAETGADKKAYGASTLRAEHVSVEGDTLHFKFVGKKGVKQNQKLKDERLARLIAPRIKEGQPLFQTTPAKIHEYLNGISSQHYKVKDFRTYVATNLALKLQGKMRKPKDAKTYKKQVKKVCELVAKKLGNTPIMAKNSYIDPTVWKPWQEGIDMEALQPKKRKVAESQLFFESIIARLLQEPIVDYVETRHYQAPS